jgi:hypothetical protein
MIKTGAEKAVAMQQSGVMHAAARWASGERSEHTQRWLINTLQKHCGEL